MIQEGKVQLDHATQSSHTSAGVADGLEPGDASARESSRAAFASAEALEASMLTAAVEVVLTMLVTVGAADAMVVAAAWAALTAGGGKAAPPGPAASMNSPQQNLRLSHQPEEQ